MRSALFLAVIGAMVASAAAEPTGLEPPGARSTGRAGVGLVSDDSAVVLLSNPAAVARRGGRRFSLGMRLGEIDTEVIGETRTTSDQSGPSLIGSLAYAQGLGDRWVVAIAFAETADHQRRYPAPRFNQDPAEVADLFFYRYGGLAGSAIQRTVSAGAAVRATDWLAVGASMRISTLEVSETRSLWAGFSDREPVGSADRDLILTTSAETFARPGASAGLLAAPIEIPIEIAAGVSIDLPATLSGTATLAPTTDAGTPPVPGPGGEATLEHPGRIVAATGLRYLGARFIAEVNAELSRAPGRDPRWRLEPIAVTDVSGATGMVDRLDPLLEARSQHAIRGAVDVALVPGFLWLTGGYSTTSAATSSATRGPLQSARRVHRIAGGAEALWSGFTVTVGYARELSVEAAVSDGAATPILNPFDAGSGPATAGRYRRSADIGALRIEYAW